jgi:hypothetical protein
MTIARLCTTIFAAALAVAGLAVWVGAAVSAVPYADSAPLWVVLGALLSMIGFGLCLLALHPPEPGGP